MPSPDSLRERILVASYRLFAEHGVLETSVSELVHQAGVTRASFYSLFTSKDEVALACLEYWQHAESEALDAALARHDRDGREALLAAFDVFGAWPGQGASEVGAFLGAMLELGREHPVGAAIGELRARRRALVTRLASDAGLADPEGLAWSWNILLEGALIASAEGDRHAHEHAKAMAALLLRRQRQDAG